VNGVFLEVRKSADKFSRRSQVSIWLLDVAHYKALAARRRRSASELLDAKVFGAIKDSSDGPDGAIGRKQNSAIKLNCLSNLSCAHRKIIDLFYYHGKTISESAEIIGIGRIP